MKKWIMLIAISLFSFGSMNAQKVRWSYAVEGAVNGTGTVNRWKAGFGKYCAAVSNESEEGATLKKSAKDPGVIHFFFRPFDAKQLIIIENYNPGAIAKIVIGYRPNGEKTPLLKTIYEGETKVSEKAYVTTNHFFDLTKNITDVYVYMDYVKIPGVNQIAGVALADFKEPYEPDYNFAKEEPFVGSAIYMNDNVSGNLSPTCPKITIDGKYIYFNHESESPSQLRIFRGEIGSNGTFSKVELSPFNLPYDKSSHSGLVAISQDNNVFYINDMSVGKLNVFKTFLKTRRSGSSSWVHDKLNISGYESNSKTINDIMSYDEKYYIVNMNKDKGEFKEFGEDIYVAVRDEKGNYGNFIRMGDDINTIGHEVPCFLAADNKTFFFASNGWIGYGKKDIYVTHRLDDTWTNWSQPINLGSSINSDKQENYFFIDSKGEYAYFVRWDKDGSNLYRIALRQPKAEEEKIRTIKPEPVVVVKGKVLDKKTNKPLQASIFYNDILTGTLIGKAMSNGETGEYSIALPLGKFYSYEANAERYLPISENIDVRELKETTVIEKDLYLVPIEVGQVVRLNNIFFDFGKSTLRPESFVELDRVVKILNENPKMEIEMSGHTDNVGSKEANMKLSDDRAKTVKEYIVSKGILENRISAKGYGETKPIASNDTEEGKQWNRRVEFTILKN